MRHRFFDIAFTPSVRAEQDRQGSRAAYAAAAVDAVDTAAETLTTRETDFLAARDSFYLSSVSETGWPYVQHRGGPAGFVRPLNGATIGWAEYRGNRQYVSVGNTTINDRVALIFMDYPNRRRLKVLGHLHTFSASDRPDLSAALVMDGYPAKVERFAVVTVDAFDWNCPQHITPRFTVAEVKTMAAPLKAKIAELEERLRAYEASAATGGMSPSG